MKFLCGVVFHLDFYELLRPHVNFILNYDVFLKTILRPYIQKVIPRCSEKQDSKKVVPQPRRQSSTSTPSDARRDFTVLNGLFEKAVHKK